MLKKLSIKNIALIEFCEVEFGSKLNVFSGETGSGKSIVVDAISFVLGGRTDKSIIKSGCEEASVTAEFDNIKLTRTLTECGKNMCEIDGNKASLQALKEAAASLVDIHGQHENQKLLNEKKHAEILDAFIGEPAAKLKSELAIICNEILNLNARIKNIGGSPVERERAADFLNYQIKEIEHANLKEGEFETLKERREVLQNAQKIAENLSGANQSLAGESGAITGIDNALMAINSIKNLKPSFCTLAERLATLKIEAKDIAAEVENEYDAGENSEDNLEKTEERLDLVKMILRKYGGSFEQVQKQLYGFKQQLADLAGSEQLLEQLNAAVKEQTEAGYKICESLTALRKKSAKEFEKLISIQLKDLGMPSSQFIVCFEECDAFNKTGSDDIVFLFTANLGEVPKALVKIVSGGELSRLSLAIKTLTAHKDNIATMIFDEADTGISGNMAQVVGEKMTIASRGKQVLVVTHLPQIAAFADTNFLVEKCEQNGCTQTSVTRISGDKKIAEIARLIGSKMANTFAFDHAREMVQACSAFKATL